MRENWCQNLVVDGAKAYGKPLMTSTFATCSPLVTDQCMKANVV
jgi:hypothetical protein